MIFLFPLVRNLIERLARIGDKMNTLSRYTHCIIVIFFLIILSLPQCRPAAVVDPESDIAAFEIKKGERVIDLCRRMEKSGVLSCSILKDLAEKSYPRFTFLPGPAGDIRRFEGIFSPGLYRISLPPGFSPLQKGEVILDYLLDKCGQRYSRLKDPSLALFQKIILASMVEKEAAGGEDYQLVASVFRNRLKKKGTLGSCPTVEYALGYHRPFLLHKDLEIQSPYNVYKNRGLPPGPIAFFSDDALLATEYTPVTSYYFFVLDWTTLKLSFSITFEEHERKAKIARKKFIEKYGAGEIYRVFPELYYEPIPVPEEK